ncbi:DUF1365 domain-containing protein [Comamonas sp. MYb69]|uniref:DUF1365 domain-containing protein n=1 Tax=Comamonas sp. MYb69 TaxID=1848650 RepID=UPI0030A21F62
MSNRSLIGFGHIWHQRLRPVVHAFRYPGYFLLLPLRSLRGQPDAVLHRNRRGLISFYDRDHGDGSADCLAWFDQLLQQEGIEDAAGEIWLHTFPRVLGYAFKPVSFWYAHRADGSLAAVLAEVNNTFGERHAYLLAGPDLAWGTEQLAAKCFHVSPFCTVQGAYRFRFVRSDSRNLVQVDLHDEAGALLRTGVAGRLQPLTRATVRRAFWAMPLMTWGVVLRIHWQALRLWLKRLPFHRKPSEPKRFVTR